MTGPDQSQWLIAALGKLGNQSLDFAFGMGIEAGRGLIEQQHIGTPCPGPRQRQTLLLAARQLPATLPGNALQANTCQGLLGLRFGHRPGQAQRAVQPQAQGHIHQRRQPQQVRALKQHGLAQRRIAPGHPL